MQTVSILEATTELWNLSDLVLVQDCKLPPSVDALERVELTLFVRCSSVNIPFPDMGMGDADYVYAFQQIVMPIAYEFAPDIVLGSSRLVALYFLFQLIEMSDDSVSAGYDAAAGDELGKMKVSPAGYAHMTHLLSALCGGKLVLALEVSSPSS
jgi:hypothetical protein